MAVGILCCVPLILFNALEEFSFFGSAEIGGRRPVRKAGHLDAVARDASADMEKFVNPQRWRRGPESNRCLQRCAPSHEPLCQPSGTHMMLINLCENIVQDQKETPQPGLLF